MNTIHIPSVRGDNHRAAEAAHVVNQIISEINISGNRKPGAKLYLGHKQKYALRQIEQGDPARIYNNEFFGWPIIWVLKESHIHLAV